VPGLSAPALFSSPERGSSTQQEIHDSLWQYPVMERTRVRVWNCWFFVAVPSRIWRVRYHQFRPASCCCSGLSWVLEFCFI